MATTDDVLDFWLGPLDARGASDDAHQARWWRKDPALDAEIRDRFLGHHEAIERGERDDWLATPRGRVAYVIVLDQFSRNMFRGTPRMFAMDERACATASAGIDAGEDRGLEVETRGFLYMPFMHSEDIAVQERGVALYTAWRDEVSEDLRAKIARSLDFMQQHRDIVARFGRFPHRNEVLQRASTAEETEFLKQPGSSF